MMTEFYACVYGVRLSLILAYYAADLLLIYITARACYERRPAAEIIPYSAVAAAFIALTSALAQCHYYSFRIGLWKVRIPAVILLIILAAGTAYAAGTLIRDIRRGRSQVTAQTVREAMDNIPAGIGYFDRLGFPRLVNAMMLRIGIQLTGSDFQSLEEVRTVAETTPVVLPSGSMYSYTERPVTDESGREYTGVFLFDVTELQNKRLELEKQTEALRKLSEQLRFLNENAYKLAREEEVLAFQTRLHDAMGAGITAVHRILEQDLQGGDYLEAINVWRRSAEMAYDEGTGPDNMSMRDFAADSEALGVQFVLDGEIPDDRETEEVVMTALRTALTNCIKHAGATEMHASASEEDGVFILEITNNGKQPESEIVPGGGISNLMERASRAGGYVETETQPEFRLRVRIPLDREEFIK